jgi:putative peptidoglycan lipid II flippase
MSKLLRFFRPSHQHTAFSATLLLMGAVMLSRVIGYIREAYIAYAFGAGPQTDAYVAAFTLPDWLNYIVAGGAASITFISIYTRFLAEKRDADAKHTFSVVITVMSSVMIAGTVLAEIFTPEFVRWMFRGFSPAQVELTVYLTRILLPAQIFFYVGGVVSAVLLSHRLFLFPAFGPLLYNVFIILGGVVGGPHLGIASLAYGALAGAVAGPFMASVIGAARIGTGYRPSFDVMNPAFREWVKLSVPLMLGVSLVTADDWILRHYASSGVGDIARLNYAKRLFAVPIAVLGQATGQASLPFFARLFNDRKRFRLPRLRRIVSRHRMDDGRRLPVDRSGLSPRTLPRFRHADHGRVFFLVLAFPRALVGPGTLRPRLLRRRRHVDSDGCRHRHHRRLPAGLFHALSQLWRRWAGLGLRHRDRSESAGARLPAALPQDGFAENAALG